MNPPARPAAGNTLPPPGRDHLHFRGYHLSSILVTRRSNPEAQTPCEGQLMTNIFGAAPRPRQATHPGGGGKGPRKALRRPPLDLRMTKAIHKKAAVPTTGRLAALIRAVEKQRQ